jgi:peptide/nickel transport system permease protein
VFQYLLKRLGMTSAVLLLVMLFLAGIVHLIPGDAATLILGPRASEATILRVRAEMGLDEPIVAQIASFVGNALRGDLGRDFVTNRPVTSLVMAALPHTVVLAIASLTIAILIGIPLGVLAATRPDSLMDRAASVLSVSFIAVPSYVVGLFLLLAFPVALGVLPATGAGSFSQPVDYLRHLILPTSALALTWIGYFARLVRASMLEVISANYVRVARAYGLRERAIYYRYALKNAVIPSVAILGVSLGNLMGGAVFIEFIFARPGLGKLALDSIGTRNFPVLRGAILTVALLFVLANLVADLSYRFIDPRIRVEAKS